MRQRLVLGIILIVIGVSYYFYSRFPANIIQATSLDPIAAAIEEAVEGTLVIFDINDVLIVPKDQVLQASYKYCVRQFIDHMAIRDKTKAQNLESLIWMQHQVTVVDPKIFELFEVIKARGLKAIALTGAWTGRYGLIPDLEEQRIQFMKRAGFDFQGAFSTLQSFRLVSLKDKCVPGFKSGILFTCGVPKGDVLGAFLAQTGLKPRAIIFIDDKRSHLESVLAYCGNTPCLGFHYTAAEGRTVMPLNESRVRVQFDVLEKEQRWISDQEADQRLKP